jgi:hypothetical protein
VNPPVPPRESAGIMTPAEREARWALSVRFAIEAASGVEARAILTQALARLDRELPLQGEPTITPLRLRDGIWVVGLVPDLTALASVEPDDAANRCRYVSSHFGVSVGWISRHTERVARWDWPSDIWSRSPEDDILLHPAVRAVMILCEAKKGETPCLGGRRRSRRDLLGRTSPRMSACPCVAVGYPR